MNLEDGSTRLFLMNEQEFKMLERNLCKFANTLPMGNEKMAYLGLGIKLRKQWEEDLFNKFLSKQAIGK
tara:strand:+ start:369 stop:575 length:207 start_codon:yes stop_codon:yes gene_type:complete